MDATEESNIKNAREIVYIAVHLYYITIFYPYRST